MSITGKMRREQEKEYKEEGKEANRRVTGWFKKVMESGRDYADEQHEKVVAMARANRLNDFMEICGVGEPSQIDYDNPHVKILWLECDPVNVRMLTNPKYRQKVYDKMDPET